jgi:hypothetical protein
MVQFTEKDVGAGLSQLFMSLLGLLEAKRVLSRDETLFVFDQAARALRQLPDDPINAKAALFVETLSAEARKRN